jgi:CMP/dCMP kinase
MEMKKHIITIAGKPGSGKSTTARNVAEALNYGRFSSGDLFRSIGKERGVNVNKINEIAETEKEIDELVDQKLRDIGAAEDNLVIDSRMAWHWMPYSFRVYLDLDLEVAATRIIRGMDETRRAVEHVPETPEEYAMVLANRLESEIKRYNSLYEVNPYDPANYDLVVDTAVNNPEQAAKLIVDSYEAWLKRR